MSEVLRSETRGDELVLALGVARLDAAKGGEFKEAVGACWREGIRRVTIEMGAVEFVDSSGVGALLNVYKRMAPGTGTVVLKGARPAVQSVIELLRLHRIFELQP